MPIMAIATAATLAISANAGNHNLVTADINDPVSLRINIMQNVGASAGLIAGMMKKEIPFNPYAATAALKTINTAALGLSGLFPAGMPENMRSSAGPAIWADQAGFKAAIAKFIEDSTEVNVFPPETVEELQAAFAVVGANCKSCHQNYRIKR